MILMKWFRLLKNLNLLNNKNIMLQFIWDFIKYPFDKNKEKNKFSKFLKLILKDYPAFLWIKPNWQRIVVFPILSIAKIFQSK